MHVCVCVGLRVSVIECVCVYVQLNLRTKDTLGMGVLSFLQRLSLSRRFTVL